MDKKHIANLDRDTRVSETARIGVAGMTCDHCVRRVEGALRKLPGVKDVAVDRTAALATVTYDSSATDIAAMHEAILKSGYKPVAQPAE